MRPRMSLPALPPERQHFVDDELLRAPLLGDQVVDAALADLRQAMPGMSARERALGSELLTTAERQRSRLVEAFAESVRRQVADELGGRRSAATPGKAAGGLTLALLDEDEVAADVEISHAIEGIKSVAEHELRELATFTAALAGDMDVSQDHNPFRAETYGRALWDAAQALPMARGYQVLLMRHASAPMAQILRKAYAGSCARLESAGIEPAVYRTLILPSGVRSGRPSESWTGRGPDLNRIRETMPAPLMDEPPARSREMPLEHAIDDADRALRALPAEAPLTERARLLDAQRSRLVRYADRAVDQQLIELLSRLFDAILADRRVARDIQVTLSRLQAAVLRLALRDPQMLDDYAHPTWRFMDLVAHLAALQREGSEARADTLRFVEGLIDHLARESAPSATLYGWAVERLIAHDKHRLERRLQRATPDIAMLQAMEDRLVEEAFSPPTGAGPLDESQLHTVPAELMEQIPPPRPDAPDETTWLNQRKPGEWLRMFMRGRWVRVQLLWQGQHGDAWLFGEGTGDTTCGVRRRALERLYQEGLLTLIRPRSLLRAAAEQVMDRAGPAPTH